MEISQLITHFKNTWFLEILVLLLNFLALYLCQKKSPKCLVFLFKLYFLTNILVLTSSWILTTTLNFYATKRLIYNSLNTIISLIEFLTYMTFFGVIIKRPHLKPYFKFSVSVFYILEILYFFTRFSFLTDRSRYVYSLLNVIEFLILIPPCLFYYYDLFNTSTAISLSSKPSFWIVTGIFTFSVISIPFYLLDPLLWDIKARDREIIGIFLFQLPIIINLSLLIRGLVCKKTLTT